jgi:hypothetical protein
MKRGLDREAEALFLLRSPLLRPAPTARAAPSKSAPSFTPAPDCNRRPNQFNRPEGPSALQEPIDRSQEARPGKGQDKGRGFLLERITNHHCADCKQTESRKRTQGPRSLEFRVPQSYQFLSAIRGVWSAMCGKRSTLASTQFPAFRTRTTSESGRQRITDRWVLATGYWVLLFPFIILDSTHEPYSN